MRHTRSAAEGDPRLARTRAQLRSALFEACRTTPLERLSVSEVVRLAGVGRATFYLHYGDLHDLATDACTEPVREAVEALHSGPGFPDPDSVPPLVSDTFAAILARAEVYRRLLRPGGGGPLGELLFSELRGRAVRERERRHGASPRNAVAAAAVAATFVSVLAGWLHGQITGTPEDVATTVWRLLGALHRNA